jgi:hypothetical protein
MYCNLSTTLLVVIMYNIHGLVRTLEFLVGLDVVMYILCSWVNKVIKASTLTLFDYMNMPTCLGAILNIRSALI